MDIKDLNKTQLILLTLLITFVVSIATGIITVSLMQQAPKSVPATINNIIQRTIEKVTTEPESVPVAIQNPSPTTTPKPFSFIDDSDVVVSIYSKNNIVSENPPSPTLSPIAPISPIETPKALGQGIIISDVGLILVDTSILNDKDIYRVVLNKMDFDAILLKKYSNGFTILKITKKSNPQTTGATSESTAPKVNINP